MTGAGEFSTQDIQHFGEQLCRSAGQAGFRAVLVVSGTASWCREQAAVLLEGEAPRLTTWWVGGEAPLGCQALDWSRARTRLGSEAEQLVIDAHEGFDAEGFGALSGTLKAGGLLLLLTPSLQRWHRFADPQHARFALYPHPIEGVTGHFLSRLARVLQSTPGIALIAEGAPLPALPRMAQALWRPFNNDIYATAEQQEAVSAIHHLVAGHRHRPLVLSADRGRGKSAALGIAAAQQLHQGLRHVVVTAPRLSAASQVFGHAERLLPGCEVRQGRVIWQGGMIEFVPPDALLIAPREAQLLLVDEAAAIPAPMLERLLAHYPRIVFATTIHGYEGTGRGFSVRFQQVLHERTPGWRSLHLSAPVRWAEGDPLERLSFRALLLDAEPVAPERVASAAVENCQFECLDRSALSRNEEALSELFGLLVLAHYRTSPNDLRQLLDGPQQSLYVLRHAGHIVATALVVEEGQLEPELARPVYLGRRRVQGHLLPQSLANHAGFAEALELRAARVMRIAVLPALQGRGLGSYLIEQLQQEMLRRGCDYLGASFGATVELLQFWYRQGLLPVRLGLSQEASSGSHSVMMVTPLTPQGETLVTAVWERFAETLPELLAGPLSTLDEGLAQWLLQAAPPIVDETIRRQDRRDIESFAFGLRGYELCMLAIRKLVLQALSERKIVARLEPEQLQLLQRKVVQRQEWELVVRLGGFSGRKQALQALREAVAILARSFFDGAGTG